MKYLSLFSGIGGFELGIQQAYEIYNMGRTTKTSDTENGRHQPMLDFSDGDRRRTNPRCIGFSEIDKYATEIYQKHFPNHKNYGDIKTINPQHLPDFELLVGGFPCQSFSVAGKRKGFEDTRGTLFFDICKIVREKQPRLLLLENVKGLLSHDKGATFTTIISTLDELGYDIQWQVLNSKNHGVPQNRERVFIIGHLRGTSRPEVFPFGESFELSDKSRREGKIEGGIASTITTNYHKGVHSGGETYALSEESEIRRLTPKECERLQGFPDDWTEGVSDTQRYKCCGNAVTVNVIRDICKKLWTTPLNK